MPENLLDLLRQIQNPDEGTDLTPIFEQLEIGISGQAAALTERDETIGTLNTDITRLKAKNYELMVQIPVDNNQLPAQEQQEQEPAPISINDLFKKDGE